MSKKTADILRKARALIEKPENWAKGDLAYDGAGDPVEPEHNEACAWCAVGAICRVENELRVFATGATASLSLNLNPPRIVASFNDDPNTTHIDVLDAFDRAIAAEEAAQ